MQCSPSYQVLTCYMYSLFRLTLVRVGCYSLQERLIQIYISGARKMEGSWYNMRFKRDVRRNNIVLHS